jgi:glycosyltransferase involved in cell wall biosynthesis
MVRVVHVIGELSLGGAERALLEFVTHFDRALYEPHVLCLYKAGDMVDTLESAGVPVTTLGIKRGITVRGWLRLWRTFRRFDAAIVHAHLPEACRYGLSAAWLARVPVRVGHVQNCKWRWTKTQRTMDRVGSAFATTVIACSSAVRGFCRDALHYPQRKISVIYNPVDLSRFRDLPVRERARRILGLPGDAPIVVCVASLSAQKGHVYLLEAMPHVVREFPNVQLLLVGDGNKRVPLNDCVQRLGLSRSVQFLGKRHDVPTILAASDVFVLASEWEGMGLAVAEAGAAGLASVVVEVDGLPEVVESGVTGLLVPPRNPHAMADGIITLLQDPVSARAMGENARKRIEERFNVDRLVEEIEYLYRRSLGGRAA